jgi:glycosyltransferase involved in cell wall biosynthesis
MERVLPRRVRARNRVIPDGVDRTRFTPAGRDDARRQLGWDPDEIVVLSVGRRSPIKRLELAEEAVAVARRRVPALRWHAVTDVAPEDLPPYYSAADCLLHTSISEGSPNVVKEALACDLPVVATPSGDIPELLDGVAPSALCPADPQALAEAVIRCAADRRRSNGRARTERLGLEAVSRRLAECYAALADLR